MIKFSPSINIVVSGPAVTRETAFWMIVRELFIVIVINTKLFYPILILQTSKLDRLCVPKLFCLA
jgi:hypothetical protein